jgi:hypothetical protein
MMKNITGSSGESIPSMISHQFDKNSVQSRFMKKKATDPMLNKGVRCCHPTDFQTFINQAKPSLKGDQSLGELLSVNPGGINHFHNY